MREPVVQITLRVPTAARDYLRDICAQVGVTRRGLFEAVVTVGLADECHPVWGPVVLWLWAATKTFEEAGHFQAPQREKIIVHMEPELAARFKAACQRHGVSQNATLSMMLLPGLGPGPEPGPGPGPEVEAYRLDYWPRVVSLARRLDFERRSRHQS